MTLSITPCLLAQTFFLPAVQSTDMAVEIVRVSPRATVLATVYCQAPRRA